MTPEYLLTDAVTGISAAPETAINTPYTLSADFLGFKAVPGPAQIPVPESVTDEDMSGGGDEHAEDSRLYYWSQNAYTYSGKLNSESAARLGLRGLGGPITDTVVTAAASWDHAGVMQTRAQGTQPKYTTLIHDIGGADFLHASMAVNQFGTSKEGGGEPQFNCELIGTGYHRRLRDITPAIVVPAPVTHHYFHGAAAAIQLNDGTLRDLSATARVESYTLGYSNNLILNKRRSGDPFITPGDINSGAYVRVLNRGKRTSTAQLKLTLTDTLAEYGWLKNNTTLTSFQIKEVGQKIGATAESFEFQWNVPKSKIEGLTGDSTGENASVSFNLKPLKDSVSLGLVTLRARNSIATMA